MCSILFFRWNIFLATCCFHADLKSNRFLVLLPNLHETECCFLLPLFRLLFRINENRFRYLEVYLRFCNKWFRNNQESTFVWLRKFSSCLNKYLLSAPELQSFCCNNL